jgi:hypothetical protein
MGYVMVPVPEEHVEAVMQFVLREMARASLQPWDEPSVTQVYEEVDEATRSLLAFVARATLEGVDLSDAEAAAKIQLTAREAIGIVNELQVLTRDASRPPLLSPRAATERLPNGRTTTKRVITMEPEVAELVRAVEEAELRAMPHPLGEPAG